MSHLYIQPAAETTQKWSCLLTGTPTPLPRVISLAMGVRHNHLLVTAEGWEWGENEGSRQ